MKTETNFLTSAVPLYMKSILDNDERVQIFERQWKHSIKRRAERRIEAVRKIKHIVLNLITSIVNLDDIIKEQEAAFFLPTAVYSKPIRYLGYKITHIPRDVPNDFRVTLYKDLVKEQAQNGERGRVARTRLRNMIYHLFYLEECRMSTYIWLNHLHTHEY